MCVENFVDIDQLFFFISENNIQTEKHLLNHFLSSGDPKSLKIYFLSLYTVLPLDYSINEKVTQSLKSCYFLGPLVFLC